MALFDFLKNKASDDCMRAIVSGEVRPIETVEDEVFSAKILGNGVAFEPDKSQSVVCPADGVVTTADKAMPHALGLKLANGAEVLIHVGIDTVEIKGKGFGLRVSKGQKVACGQPLLDFDLDEILASGHRPTIMLVVTETEKPGLRLLSGMKAVAGQTIVAEYDQKEGSEI